MRCGRSVGATELCFGRNLELQLVMGIDVILDQVFEGRIAEVK